MRGRDGKGIRSEKGYDGAEGMKEKSEGGQKREVEGRE